MTAPSLLPSLCTSVTAGDRLHVLSILEKGFNLNQFQAWNSQTQCPLPDPLPLEESSNQESLIYNALPLHLAVIHGHVDIVSDLLNAGADPLMKDGRCRYCFSNDLVPKNGSHLCYLWIR